MLSPTSLLCRAKGYHNRVMVYAHRRRNSRYLPPRNPHKSTPLANKSPEEYGATWDGRTGVGWYYRLRHRNHYRHWPWARWTDDPIHHHEDPTCRRTFSALCGSANEGVPEWDYYSATGQEYRTPSHFPLTYAAPFIHLYTAKVWSKAQLEAYLERIQSATGLRTIEDVASHLEELHQWGLQQQLGAVPRGVLMHVELVTRDIVQQNSRQAFRQEQQETGVLRTRDMVRYYALPYISGPAMPVKLSQPSGEYPNGRYTYMMGTPRIHPLQIPDARRGRNAYPA